MQANTTPTKGKHKIVLIAYHANCIDGFTSAWLLHNHYVERGVEPTLLPVNYGASPAEVVQAELEANIYSALVIADFSFSLEELRGFQAAQEKVLSITMFDHHATAFETYGIAFPKYLRGAVYKELNYGTCIESIAIHFASHESGASLIYKVLNNQLAHINAPPNPATDGLVKVANNPNLSLDYAGTANLVAMVKDWDIWQHILPETRAVNAYIKEQEMTIANWDATAHMLGKVEDVRYILQHGTLVLKAITAVCANAAIHLATVEAPPHILPASFGSTQGKLGHIEPKYISAFGDYVNRRYGTYVIILPWDTDRNGIVVKDGRVTISVRSCNGEAKLIAEAFGGGGHLNAAGFSLSVEAYEREFTSWIVGGKYNDLVAHKSESS